MKAPDVTGRGTESPPGYRVYRTIDLKAGRAAVAVQVVFLLVAAAMVAVALWADLPGASSWGTGTTVLVSLVACLGYLTVHELTHGAALRVLSSSGARFSVGFPYLATGSDALLTKGRFVVIALAPAVVWGAVLAVALVLSPVDWFLTVYVVLALNFAGSAGDFVQVSAVMRLPRDVLLRDDGRRTTAFLPSARTSSRPTTVPARSVD